MAVLMNGADVVECEGKLKKNKQRKEGRQNRPSRETAIERRFSSQLEGFRHFLVLLLCIFCSPFFFGDRRTAGGRRKGVPHWLVNQPIRWRLTCDRVPLPKRANAR